MCVGTRVVLRRIPLESGKSAWSRRHLLDGWTRLQNEFPCVVAGHVEIREDQSRSRCDNRRRYHFFVDPRHEEDHCKTKDC